MTRFSENHELIKKVFNVVHKCFNQSDVHYSMTLIQML